MVLTDLVPSLESLQVASKANEAISTPSVIIGGRSPFSAVHEILLFEICSNETPKKAYINRVQSPGVIVL